MFYFSYMARPIWGGGCMSRSIAVTAVVQIQLFIVLTSDVQVVLISLPLIRC